MAELSGVITQTSDTYPRRAIRIADRLVDGELVLYDPDEQRLHVLNPTAGLIWRLCDGKHQESDLVDTLADRYPRSRSAIEEDVPRIIERFRTEGLLQS
jgi:hypothetical protein